MKKVITLLAILCVAAMLLAGCQNAPAPAEHTHTLIHNEEKAPTCVNNGILEHWYCPACNARFADEAATEEVTFADLEVEELGHTGGTATCTEQATCERCEKPYGDPLGHTGGTATCTEQAVCERCSQPYGSALGHTAGDAATCTTAQVCTVCNAELAPAAGHTAGAEATCTAAQTCTVCNIELAPATGHADANADYKCDNCSAKMLPADGTALTIPQALAVAKVAGTSYTTQKYYITGVIKNVYNTQYGNMYIKDEAGNEICIYGLYSADGKTRYDAMNYKPVAGDEVTVYTVLGAYGTTYQGKNAWLDEVVAHEHDYKAVVTEATCSADGCTTHTCSICGDVYTDAKVDALGHTTTSGTCERCGKEITSDLIDKTYSYTFTSTQFSANGTKTLNGVSWTLAGNGGYWGFDSNNGKGQQFGSGGNPYKSMTLTSTEFNNVKKITVNTSGASSVNATLNVYVGDTLVKTIKLTTTATTYEIDVAEVTGAVKFEYVQTSSKALYIKSIAVEYAE